MDSTTSSKTIQVPRGLFSHHSIPHVLVQGPQFCSEEFATFLKSNGVKHIRSAPFHPSINGLARSDVQALSKVFKRQRSSSAETGHVPIDISEHPPRRYQGVTGYAVSQPQATFSTRHPKASVASTVTHNQDSQKLRRQTVHCGRDGSCL